MAGDDNLQRMKTLDDAWNAQDWEVFRKRNSSDTAVHWPGQPDPNARPRRSSSRVRGVFQVDRKPSGQQPVQGDVRPLETGPARSPTGRER